MASLLADLSHLYDIRRFLDMPPELRAELRAELRYGGGWPPWWPDSIQRFSVAEALDGPPLALIRLRHGSPGFVDLAGIGKAMEQLRLLVEFLVQRKDMKSRRALENQSLAEDIIAKQIENAQRFIAAGRDASEAGLSEAEFRQLLTDVDARQRQILRMVESGQIHDLRELPPG
jgi:hypothetical protein